MMDSVDLGDENVEPAGARQRVAPPVQPQPTGPDNVRRQAQRSVSIEQAAKPSFDITVGDPHKVGDLTSSHTVYQVRTKVKCWRRYELAVTPTNRRHRHHQKHIGNPSSLSADGIGISCGSITRYTTTTQGSSSRRHQKSKPLVDSTLTSSSQGAPPWKGC